MAANKQIFNATESGQRLDIFLTEQLEGYPRAAVQKLIKEGGAAVNGKARKPSWPLAAGDEVQLTWPEISRKVNLKDIITRDGADYFVLNKPAGLLVHPQSPLWETNPAALQTGDETLAAAILAAPPEGFNKNTPRAGLVHRLDRETSGVMLVAKNEDFQTAMQELFAARQVKKTYNAICCGEVAGDEGVIDVPIGRVTGGKIKASGLGREAVTEYKVLQRKNGFSYMELRPLTGRTNQLRVHMAWLGYPVLGDWLYKGATAPRLMLHAQKLDFKHPFTGKKLSFAAKPPADFKQAWDSLA